MVVVWWSGSQNSEFSISVIEAPGPLQTRTGPKDEVHSSFCLVHDFTCPILAGSKEKYALVNGKCQPLRIRKIQN